MPQGARSPVPSRGKGGWRLSIHLRRLLLGLLLHLELVEPREHRWDAAPVVALDAQLPGLTGISR